MLTSAITIRVLGSFKASGEGQPWKEMPGEMGGGTGEGDPGEGTRMDK